MAILYTANETQFNHLGLGPLNDAVSILVTEERNGIFELEMKYPVSGKVFKELKNDRLIKADAGHKLKDQRFKIIRISKPLKGIVTVYAEHVSYLTQDLALKPKVTFSGNSRQALEHWKANLVDDNPLTVWSDISTVGKINWTIDEVENARRALGGVQGSILDVYGGEYQFDNYDIYLYQKRGVNSELLIAYGRNLVDLEQEEQIANTYTSIYPYSIYTDDDGNERMVTLPEYYIDSEHVDKYARRKILVVDFTTDEIETVSALRSAAKRYIKDNDVGVPSVNLKIQYVDLAKTLDYKHLALYEEVNLCDNVMIYFEKYDINTTAKIIKVVWDALNERYDSIEVGEARASLSQAIDTVVDGKVHNVEKLAMQTLRTADGKNTIYFGLEEPLATEYDLKKNDIWYRIVDGEFTRTYIYDGVVWQLVIDMDSQEAKQEAQQAKDRANDAVERANKATGDAQNAISKAQEGFDLAQESIGIANDAFDEIEPIKTTINEHSGEITTIKESAYGMQEQITGLDGEVTTLQKSSSRLSARIEKMDIRGYNFITHLPKLWEMGFYGIDGIDDIVPGDKYDSDQLIRLSDKYRLEPETDYVLSDHPEMAEEDVDYIETNLFLHLWNDDGTYSRYLVLNFENEEHFITFKTTSTETQFSLHVMPTSIDNPLNPNMIHEVFHYKLALGTERSGWTPNLDDTGELVSDVQHFVTEFEATAESLAGRLSDAEGNLTTLTATVDGLQTTVSDVQGNVANLTVVSNAMQARLTDAEGNINTLTQTVDATVSRISSLANPNLITHDPDEWVEMFGFKAVEEAIPVKKNTDYVLTDYSSELVDKIQINYSHQLVDANVGGSFKFNSGDADIISLLITTSDLDFLEKLGTVYRFKLEEGTESTAWTAHDEDIYTQYSQLSDAINLRVAKGDVINQINLDTSGVMISGKKLILDGDTTVTGQFKVRSANIISLDAGKVTVGDLVGHSLVGGSVIGGYIEQQSGNGRLEMYNGRIDSFYRGNLALRLGQHRIEFYNIDSAEIGSFYPITGLGSGNQGIGFEISDDSHFGLGINKNGVLYPSLSIQPHRNRAYLAGPYSGAITGSRLELYANRRHLSQDVDFTSYDQPSIILDQSGETNDLIFYYGGTNRRSGATASFKSRVSPSSSRNVLELTQTGVRVRNNYLRIGGSGNPVFRSNAIRRRTSTNDANVRINPDSDSDGLMYRTTSSEKQKVNIESIPYEHALKVLDLTPSTWHDKNDCETYAEYLSCGDRSLLSEVEHIRRIPGLIAEDVERAGLVEFVEYANDEIVNINSKLWTLLIPITRQHNDDIEWLKLENQYLRQKLELQDERIKQLEGAA